MSAIWADEPVAKDVSAPSSLSLWRYVLVFALVFYGSAIVIGGVLEYFDVKKLSNLGNIVIFLAAWIVCDRFARHRRRLFYAREANRIMLYCLLTLLFGEALVLLGTQALLDKMVSGGLVWITVVFTVALNALCVWLAFRFFGRRVMVEKLNKLRSDAA